MAKTFISVTAQHDKTGNIHPLIMHWPYGRKFEIDRVLDVRMAPSLIGGGHGMRYVCRMRNKEANLFCDEGIWFVNCPYPGCDGKNFLICRDSVKIRE